MKRGHAGLAILILLLSCRASETATVSEVLSSDLQGEQLLDQFSTAIEALSDDKERMKQELGRAGFVPQPYLTHAHCKLWVYEAAIPADDRLRAFVTACDDGEQNARLLRLGIARGPLSYD